MALTTDGPAPYGPPGPIKDVIERFRRRGLQTPFTQDVLSRAGVSESLTRRVLYALKQLDFVDADGSPSAVLEKYAKAPDDEARAVLEKAVRDAYEPVFRYVNPTEDPPDRIRDAFRSYEPRAQQPRMVMLFLGMCEYAGIIPETKKRPAAPPASRPRSPKPATAKPPWVREKQGEYIDLPAGVPMAGLPDAIAGLVRELPRIGPIWTRERRDMYIRLLQDVIDFSYPVQGTSTDRGE